MQVDLSALWPGAVGSLLAFGVTWGALRTTLNQLREEVKELKTVSATINGLNIRLSLAEDAIKRMEENYKAHHKILRGLQRVADASAIRDAGAVRISSTHPVVHDDEIDS